MKFEKLKLAYVDTMEGLLISIQEDCGQVDDPELAVAGVYNPSSKGEAYAKLFAAAPELLELIKITNNSLHGTHTIAWQERARKAISKAQGEM